MKLSNERLQNIINGVSGIVSKTLPVRASYAISKNVGKIESELKNYNVERERLLDKYCVKNADGEKVIDENNNLTIDPEFLSDWNKDIKELLAIENEIDVHTFDISVLDGYDMAASELMLIDFMIV